MDAAMNATTLEWGVAALPFAGESESGDEYVVKAFDAGALVAVIDALGHGPEAAYTAGIARVVLEQHAGEKPAAILRRCHEEMRNTRGAAISVASFDWSRRIMTWLGIGNVSGVLVRADAEIKPRVKQMVVHGGVVGYQLPEPRPITMQIAPGDTLILATDGVRSEFADIDTLPSAMNPQVLADKILEAHATANDDSLVLVFLCGGNA
jgi:negative regulator of sigma-B (phosphoserine phosphatase)